MFKTNIDNICCIGGDERNFGTIGYLIGNKYDFYGDQESAVKYHTEYFHLCQTIHDDAGMGKACQALAEANKRFVDLFHPHNCESKYTQMIQILRMVPEQRS